MSELLTQLGTLIGVVIGAAATFVVTAAGAEHSGIVNSTPAWKTGSLMRASPTLM
jgi:gas vesicle protein